VSFYLSNDSTITTSDTFVKQVTRSGIAGVSSDSWTETMTIPSMSAGQYYVGIIVDLFTSRGGGTECGRAWSSAVCSSDLDAPADLHD
jgi:hypothetical protein